MSGDQIKQILTQLEDHEKRILALEGGEVMDSTKKKPADGSKQRPKGKG